MPTFLEFLYKAVCPSQFSLILWGLLGLSFA